MSKPRVMEPIYTAKNTTAAYQLNWSLALFGKSELPKPESWLEGLKAAAESDGARILSANAHSKNTLQFLVSTRPGTSPSKIVRCVKGRMQYLIRDRIPKAFRRNDHIQSIGEANSSVLDQYVEGQTAKHPMADRPVQARLESPDSVALSLMNNIAFLYGMKPILKFSFYAGTFGGYDRGAVREN